MIQKQAYEEPEVLTPSAATSNRCVRDPPDNTTSTSRRGLFPRALLPDVDVTNPDIRTSTRHSGLVPAVPLPPATPLTTPFAVT